MTAEVSESMSIEAGKEELPFYTSWRGLGGWKPTSVGGVEFDKQLDRLSLWVEDWDHDKRCNILEGIMSRSGYNQIQFLWTVTQPALHRDFMYTARKEFPKLSFNPVSTHQTRKTKEKAKRMFRKQEFHRVQSAYMRHVDEAKEACRERELPNFDLLNIINREKNKTHVADKVDKSQNPSKSMPYLPQISNTEYQRKQELIEQSVGLNAVQGQRSSWEVIRSAPPTLSDDELMSTANTSPFIEMPIRRHMQDCQQSKAVPEIIQTNTAQPPNQSMSRKTKKALYIKIGDNKSPGKLPEVISDVPPEAWKVFHWYEDEWSDVQRNEFLHKFLLKLDPRQHYFISSYLAVKQYRDFLEFLPIHLSLKILSHLSPSQLVKVSMVSKTWYNLANHNDLWKVKCQQVKIEIPLPRDPVWKKVYKDNIKVRHNWLTGRCNMIECKGHSKNVLSLAFDKRRMASGSSDSSIKIWDLRTGNQLSSLRGHTKGVWCLNFFTRNLLLSGSYDSTIKIWNLKQATTVRTIIGHDGPVWCLCRRGNTVISGSQDKTAKVWDIRRCLLQRTLTGHNAAVFSIDMDEEGKIAVTGSADRSVRIWDVETGTFKKIIWVSQTTSIMSVSYSHGYIACCYGETICLYQAEGGKLIKTFNEHQKRVECVQLKITNKDRRRGILISAGQDGLVKYWEINQNKSSQTFEGHGDKSVTCLRFDELRIASASHDHKIRLWDFSA